MEIMKKLLLLVLVLFSFGFGAKAHDFAVMNSDGKLIYYNICSTTSPYSAMVTYKGNGPLDYTGEYSGVINIPSTVVFNSITYSVDSINSSCFDYSPTLTSVIIPNSVKSIGRSAFNACHSLTSVTLPNGITSIKDNTFAWCKSLSSIIIPNTVTSIGMSAFYGDSSLASITLSSSLTKIESYAFNTCSSLSSIIIPNSVTKIGSSVFENCTSLSSITLPNSLDSIPDYTFRQCSALSSIVIPNSVTYIGGWSFINCSNLSTITLPANISTIYNYTFYGCTNLDSIIIPNKVKSIGDCAFKACSFLKKVVLPNSITDIGNEAFAECTWLSNVILPSKLTSINNNTFRVCNALTSIILPNSITSIGYASFQGCINLSSINIPNSVTSIGGSAFSYCTALTSITIPSSVTSISPYAFEFCYGLTSITNLSLIPQSINNTTFNQVSKTIPLYVPCGYAAVYQAASNWNAFTNIQANKPITKNINAIICPNQAYTQNGFNVDSSGIYTRNLTAVGGCDSIIYLILRVKTPDTTRIDASICQGQVYNYNGFNANSTGLYYRTIPSSLGCDSTLILNLFVSQLDTTIINAIKCANHPYILNGFYTGAAGTHYLHLYNQHGCDSTVILNLSNYNSDTTFINANICQGESYNFFSMNYYSPGTYSARTYSSHWCDSIVVLNLTVSQKYYQNYYEHICQGETFNQYGFNCDTAGTYVHNYQTVNGCDSIVTLYLTVYPNTSFSIYDTICQGQPYWFNGENKDSTGVYTYTYQDMNGCNVTTTLNLFVKNKSYFSFDTTVCNYFNYNGMGFSSSGTYNVNLVNSVGCDSVITINLTIPKLEAPKICMVTINENNNNVVIWNKNEDLDNYIIYKEGNQSGQFDSITSFQSSSPSTWTDLNSNASTRSYRYRLASKDTCSNIEFSPIHKTLHLTINQGLNNSWNLIWTHYEGIDYSTYNIYKGRVNNADSLFLLTTISSNNSSYTDFNVNDTSVFYQIEIMVGQPCSITKSLNSIRSNIVSNTNVGLSDIENNTLARLYPNPASNKTILEVQGLRSQADVIILDLQGREIKRDKIGKGNNVIEIDLKNLEKGVYNVILKNKEINLSKKLIVQ
ncbi:MAG: cell surface protein [Bacteroidetes bacterium]|nr:cell surface protein [Bacteroidota bacterium]